MTPARGAARIRGLYGILDPSVLARAFPGGWTDTTPEGGTVTIPGEDGDALLDRALSASLAGGIPVVQYRDKEAPPRLLLSRAKRLSLACRAAGALFLVNDRLDVALLAGADGCHLGQDDLPLAEARRAAPRGFLLGLSTHGATEAMAGRDAGADYLGVGAVYATSTKEDATTPRGPALVEEVRLAVPEIPLVAIGGITLGSASALFRAGAAAVAVASDLFARDDVRERTEAYLRLAPL